MFSRRRFLSQAGALSASAAAFPFVPKSGHGPEIKSGQRPRHIIHMVVDGMSMGTLTCAEYFSQIVRGRGLTFMSLFNERAARLGWMNMRSLNSMVTDSSAASSSWGSGSRIINGAVNMLPNGTKLTTLYELFGAQGWKRGLVTTTEITHATPAGFAGCVDDRDTGSQIAVQYLERKVDVLLGGGLKFFESRTRRDRRDVRTEFKTAGYHTMSSAEELAAAPTGARWLGTFANSHVPYVIDQLANPNLHVKVPSLATMTGSALRWLERHNNFILQVEGGRVDHACHNCDAPAALREMVAFDEALDVVLQFKKRHPETLIVLTSDHGNGNMGANGTGSAYGQSSWMFRHTAGVKSSFPEIIRQLKRKPEVEDTTDDKKDSDADGFNTKQDAKEETPAAAPTTEPAPRSSGRRRRSRDYIPTPKEAADIIYACTGYRPSERRAALFVPYLEKKGAPIYELMNSDMVQLGQMLGNRFGIGWTGNAHTADFVPVIAMGPGSERFAGFIQNVDVFRHYTQLAKIDFRNPTEDLIVDSGRDAHEVENITEYAMV